jgi:hypothetical protein
MAAHIICPPVQRTSQMLQSISIPSAASNEMASCQISDVPWDRFRASCHTGQHACQSSCGTEVQRRRTVHVHVKAEPSSGACLMQTVRDEQWRRTSSSARRARQQRPLGWLSHAGKCIMECRDTAHLPLVSSTFRLARSAVLFAMQSGQAARLQSCLKLSNGRWGLSDSQPPNPHWSAMMQ